MRSVERSALTLVELLVVLAIIAVLIALLIPAVQSIRSKAVEMECTNHQRQIILGIHAYAGIQGHLPRIDAPATKTMFVRIHTFAYGGPPLTSASQLKNAAYLCPADPSKHSFSSPPVFLASYAANAQIFYGPGTLANRIGDGTSNTIGLAEHYFFCGDVSNNVFSYVLDKFPFSGSSLPHPATFADGGPTVPFPNRPDADNFPILVNGTQQSQGSLPGTFQHMPKPKECDFRYAQAPHRSGMVVSMMDGSVRFLAPAIEPRTYWGLVSPSSQDLLGPEW